jgi:hypothetical protein
MSATKQMNHVEYAKKVQGQSVEALRYTIADAKAAVAAMPDGVNVGYYLDEINYAVSELYRRNKMQKDNENA